MSDRPLSVVPGVSSLSDPDITRTGVTRLGMTPAQRIQAAASDLRTAAGQIELFARNGALDRVLDSLSTLTDATGRLRAAVIDEWATELGWDEAERRARQEGISHG